MLRAQLRLGTHQADGLLVHSHGCESLCPGSRHPIVQTARVVECVVLVGACAHGIYRRREEKLGALELAIGVYINLGEVDWAVFVARVSQIWRIIGVDDGLGVLVDSISRRFDVAGGGSLVGERTVGRLIDTGSFEDSRDLRRGAWSPRSMTVSLDWATPEDRRWFLEMVGQ